MSIRLKLPTDPSVFSKRVLSWYRAHRRELPWRCSPDPYQVWISEVMLQQTQVTTVLPYFDAFLTRFPTLQHLAEAEEEEVLSLWSGLGYYSRARNLLKAARQIQSEYGGRFPSCYEEVIRLPGIGRYTAGALLSIAFSEPFPVLDGNVRRLMIRYLKLEDASHHSSSPLWALLTRLVEHPDIRPEVSDFNQALMELGALVCTPQSPECGSCPLEISCRARAAGLEDKLPEPVRQRRSVEEHYTAAVIRRGDHFLMRLNSDGPYLKGFWEFPRVEGKPDGGSLSDRFLATHHLQLSFEATLPVVRHSVTYRRLRFHPVLAALESKGAGTGLRWISPSRGRHPVSSYIRKIERLLTPT